MLLRSIWSEGFLSFGQPAQLDVSSGLTVVTGPNGVGKSNLGRCLDLGRAVIGRAAGDPAADRLEQYKDAGYRGARTFKVRLALDLNLQWERDLVRNFVYAVFASSHEMRGEPQAPTPAELDSHARACIPTDSLAPLWSGSLVVHYDAAMQIPWFAAWEFNHGGQTWHVGLFGQGGSYQLRPGAADPSAVTAGSRGMTQWLLEVKPQDEEVMDFGAALRSTGQPVTFYVSSLTGSGSIPESLQELASALAVPEYSSKNFGFDEVMSAILQRGILLTDNRRLPLGRRFMVDELNRPVDLRDGSGVAAELYRLQNGSIRQRKRYAQVAATFTELTGRALGLRTSSAPPDGHGAALIIEPTVVDGYGERPLEFSGAGVQEALVLAALLPGEPGRIVVLDEPTVNLEPTMQRRLIGKLRGPGQFLVITHSADLVPVESPADLASIVRLAPDPNGSVVRRAGLDALGTRESFGWLRLLEPAQVRALLFAAAVILCEGPTEVGALPRWWRAATGIRVRDPEAANISIVSVNGDSGFGAYVRYLDAFGVPWAIVADGPALRHNSKLAKQLSNLNHRPTRQPSDHDDFVLWRKYWQRAGVFTVAEEFGDDGNKGGEFEAFLGRVDPSLLDRARSEVGGAKPLVGAYFAIEHPDPPREVLDLYKQITKRFPHVAKLD
jgi:AAA domain, putative AbiEii toxin, Type IV TA system